MAARTQESGGQRQLPRRKHVPQRMCVACRDHASKRGLTRIVRTPEGAVEIDETGKRNGRGAYLCGRGPCWDRAISSGLLGRSLNTAINDDTKIKLRSYAVALAEKPDGSQVTDPLQKES